MEVKSASDFYSKTKDFDLSDHKVYVTYLLAHFILKDKLKLERLADSEYISWFPFAETNQEKETLDERIRDIQDKISALHERDVDMIKEINDRDEKIEERIERMSTEVAENMKTITSKLNLLINNLQN
jgi:predicted  nucleic acid-binding Zn-ribbon protein